MYVSRAHLYTRDAWPDELQMFVKVSPDGQSGQRGDLSLLLRPLVKKWPFVVDQHRLKAGHRLRTVEPPCATCT